MLRDAFGEGAVYSEHADSLMHRSPAHLAQYNVLAGHFNHDSLRFLPFDDIKLFTFVRHPKKRLVSLYAFYRAHNSEAPTYNEEMRIANQCDAEAFFCDERICHSSIAWNHMTFCIMGERQWASWKDLLAANAPETERRKQLSSMRRAIRKRLHEFSFVGLQEDFERACAILFSVVLGRRLPQVRHELSVSRLHDQYSFMKLVEAPSLTESLDSVLTRLVELDDIVYEEASKLYNRQLSQMQ